MQQPHFSRGAYTINRENAPNFLRSVQGQTQRNFSHSFLQKTIPFSPRRQTLSTSCLFLRDSLHQHIPKVKGPNSRF